MNERSQQRAMREDGEARPSKPTFQPQWVLVFLAEGLK